MLRLFSFNILFKRIRNKQEIARTLFLRPIFLPNRYLNRGIKILDEEWDNLIILDACRYDYFKKINMLPGKLKKAYSLGTHTNEWVMRNFSTSKSRTKDIVYISSTPQISTYKLKKAIGNPLPFHYLENVWQWGWDDKLHTTLPENINKAYLKLKGRFPNKRFIIHYLQPHHPYVGERRIKLSKKQSKSMNTANWKPLLEAGITFENLKEVYQDNLKYVLGKIEKLLPELSGKTIITSDHGECLGEYGLIGHLPMLYIKPLIEIPWLEIEK